MRRTVDWQPLLFELYNQRVNEDKEWTEYLTKKNQRSKWRKAQQQSRQRRSTDAKTLYLEALGSNQFKLTTLLWWLGVAVFIDTEGLKLKIGICQFDIFKNKSINRFYSTILETRSHRAHHTTPHHTSPHHILIY